MFTFGKRVVSPLRESENALASNKSALKHEGKNDAKCKQLNIIEVRTMTMLKKSVWKLRSYQTAP